jgi:hypothetical protein
MNRFTRHTATLCAAGIAAMVSFSAESASFTRNSDASIQSGVVYRGIQQQATSITLRGGAEIGPVIIDISGDLAVQERDAVADYSRIDLRYRPRLGRSNIRPEFGVMQYGEYNTPASGVFVDRETEIYAGFLIDNVLNPSLRIAYDIAEKVTTYEAGVYEAIDVPGGLAALGLSAKLGFVAPDQGRELTYLTARAEWMRFFTGGFEAFGAVEATISSDDTLISDFTSIAPVYQHTNGFYAGIGLRRTF